MNAARAAKIEEIFEALIDRPVSERLLLVEAACGEDHTLITDVMLLLEADEAGGHHVLNQNLSDVAGNLFGEDGGAAIASRFGRYTVLEFLGQGGMGRVYLAEREGLGDKVAVKFLQDAWSSPERRERFAREQRMLASLNHPHIARLYDAGVENGTPWFAMEYVKGVSIVVYCEIHQLGLTERLKLFRTACEAIRYAHRNLTVHLDLKPSNILVTESGEVKLLDFGIARNLDREGQETEKTQTGLRLFSLNYASPEQIRGEMLDLQTDVHGLGIILYELLTGRTPADLTYANANDLLRYTEQEVERPSEAARRFKETAVQASPADWSDLDVLCLTALHRDRTRRYETVDSLIRDLDHFLKHEPLEARPDNWRYKLKKFIKRNRQPVIAAAAVVALVVALISIFTVRLIAAKNRALSSEARTERVNQLMLNLFKGDDDEAGPAKGLRVVELLDRGVQQARNVKGDPSLHAQLEYTLGSLYKKLGRPDRAEPLLRSALNEQRTHLGIDNSDTVKTQLELALLRKDQPSSPEAEQLAREIVERQKGKYSSDSREVAIATAVLGSVLEARGDLKNAVPLLESAEKVLSKGPASVELSQVLGDLWTAHYSLGDIGACDRIGRRQLALDRQLFGEGHPMVAVDLDDMANMQMDRGDYANAEASYRQAVAINEKWYGEAHHATGEAVVGLATSLLEQKRYDEASAAFDRALASIKSSDGEQSDRYAAVLGLMGDMARVQRDLNKAGKFYEKAAEIMRLVHGDNDRSYAAELSGLGAIYVLKGDFRRGEIVLRQALRILRAAIPAERLTAIVQIRLAAAFAGEKNYVDAEKQALAAYSTLREKTAAGSVEQRSARKELYDIYMAMHQPARAEQFR